MGRRTHNFIKDGICLKFVPEKDPHMPPRSVPRPSASKQKLINQKKEEKKKWPGTAHPATPPRTILRMV